MCNHCVDTPILLINSVVLQKLMFMALSLLYCGALKNNSILEKYFSKDTVLLNQFTDFNFMVLPTEHFYDSCYSSKLV